MNKEILIAIYLIILLLYFIYSLLKKKYNYKIIIFFSLFLVLILPFVFKYRSLKTAEFLSVILFANLSFIVLSALFERLLPDEKKR